MDAESTGIIIGSGTVGALCGVLSTWLKSKVGAKIKRPLDSDDTYMTHGECRSMRCGMQSQIDKINADVSAVRAEIREGNRDILAKLEENDAKSEQRSIHSNERVDLAIKSIYETKGRVDGLEARIRDASAAAAIGGAK